MTEQDVGTALVLALVTAVPIGLGVAAREHGWRDRWAVLALAAGTVATGIALTRMHDPDVSTADYATGLVFGSLALCAIPAGAYYALGRLVRRSGVVVAVWMLSLAPMALWLFVALLFTADFVYCPPDSYECPL